MGIAETIKGRAAEASGHDSPKMSKFMDHLGSFLQRNGITSNHATLYEFGYLDPQNKKGFYYNHSDRERYPHHTWQFRKVEGEKTEVFLVDDYSQEKRPIFSIFGKEGLGAVIERAEQNLIEAQRGIIKSPLDH